MHCEGSKRESPESSQTSFMNNLESGTSGVADSIIRSLLNSFIQFRSSGSLCCIQLHWNEQLRIYGSISRDGADLYCACAVDFPACKIIRKEPEEE